MGVVVVGFGFVFFCLYVPCLPCEIQCQMLDNVHFNLINCVSMVHHASRKTGEEIVIRKIAQLMSFGGIVMPLLDVIYIFIPLSFHRLSISRTHCSNKLVN